MADYNIQEKSYLELCSHLETLVVNGQHEQCRGKLNELNPKKFPRSIAVSIAEFAMRVNMPLYTLKVLQHIVYPESTLLTAPTSKEKVIYSTALIGLGALREAIEILDSIDPESEPESLLHRAGANLCDWDYAEAVPHLKKFIQFPGVAPYKRLVGKVNLAAAMIGMSDWALAKEILDQVQIECEANSHRLLLGNCFELKAQIEIFQGNYVKGEEYLAMAALCLKEQGGIFYMYVQKWQIICECLKLSQIDEEKARLHLQKLDSLKTQAFELRHWNTVRECDLFEALVLKNENLFKKVIMGTPSEYYRQRARKLYGLNLYSLGQFQLLLGENKGVLEKSNNVIQAELKVFDPYKKERKGKALHEKPMLLNLYEGLMQDFYQPFSLGTLFQKIYPQEKFNPFTSPARVLQLLRRLNSWFIENECPLRVEFKKSEFRLTAVNEILVQVQRGEKLTSESGKLTALKEKFQDASFSVCQASEVLGLSEVSIRRLLSKAIKDGKVVKEQKRQGLMYKMTTRKSRKKVA